MLSAFLRLAVPVAMTLLAVSPAIAQNAEVVVDQYGRRLLVDIATGEVIGRIGEDVREIGRVEERKPPRRRYREEGRLDDLEDEIRDLFDERRDDGFRRRESDTRRDGITVRRLPDVERAPLPPVPYEPRRLEPQQPESPAEPNFPDRDIASLPDTGAGEPVQERAVVETIPRPSLNKRQMIGLQVFLDREGFSPGAIDGAWGQNVRHAVSAWQDARSQRLDMSASAIEAALQRTGGPALTSYTITAADESQPFVASVPVDYAEKATMTSLAYTSMSEALAEKFHMSRTNLVSLNQGVPLRAGSTITVAAPGEKARRKVAYIVADKAREQVRAFDRNGALVVAYPATIGSAATPSPAGTHTVERTAVNPEYLYNPKINFQQGDNDKILTIPPGPNNPVGAVWIALSKPTYGIHGTPEPETIGKTKSHGCIRLTNWDALELVKLVQKGVTVEFTE